MEALKIKKVETKIDATIECMISREEAETTTALEVAEGEAATEETEEATAEEIVEAISEE